MDSRIGKGFCLLNSIYKLMHSFVDLSALVTTVIISLSLNWWTNLIMNFSLKWAILGIHYTIYSYHLDRMLIEEFVDTPISCWNVQLIYTKDLVYTPCILSYGCVSYLLCHTFRVFNLLLCLSLQFHCNVRILS